MFWNLGFLWVLAIISRLISPVNCAQKAFNAADTEENEVAAFEKYTNDSLLWAPYRPNCYFGIRPRYIDKAPFTLGIMWFDSSMYNSLGSMRHFVTDGHNLEKVSWEVYDPRIGGKEVIVDRESNLNMTISFVKSHNGENWAVRVSGKPIDPNLNSTASIVLYMDQADGTGKQVVNPMTDYNSYLKRSYPTDKKKKEKEGKNVLKFRGKSEEFGKYKITVYDNYGKYYDAVDERLRIIAPGADSSRPAHVSMHVPDGEVWRARDIFQSLMSDSIAAIVKSLGDERLDPVYNPSVLTLRNVHNFPPSNFHFIQKTFDNRFEKGFEFDIVFNIADSKETIKSSSEVTKLISNGIDEINVKFDRHFSIQDEQKRKFALETLSNLLGGIGYFQGNQLIDRETTIEDDDFEGLKLESGEEEGPYHLFSSTPSRFVFPRGFYWDEGFHVAQIMEYDFSLAVEIVMSWFEMVDDRDGWVAREVILGPEGRFSVPPEFQVQSPQVANPPTLLLAFSEMLSRVMEHFESEGFKHEGDDTFEVERKMLIAYGKKIYPKLLKHFEFFTTSQRGLIDEYVDTLEETPQLLNKLHLKHLYRWLGRTANHCFPSGLDDYPRSQPPDASDLNIDTLAWAGVMARSMGKIAQLLDLDEDVIKFQTIEREIVENMDNLHWSEEEKCYCDVSINYDEDAEEDLKLTCHKGYISLLPFALKFLPRESDKLRYFVELMSDPEELFTDYGLSSLSKKDEYFGKGENYWRSPIWLNINYLCLDALRYYFPEVVTSSGSKSIKDPVAKQARSLYVNLKANLIDNIYKNWEETGYVYENYNALNGRGSGSREFTGWTALIVNIMGRMN